MTTTDPQYDYTGAWTKDPDGNASTDDGPLGWYAPTEPDYNDFICSFRFYKETFDDNITPELSSIALLGLSLAGIPVLRRRRRS